MTRLVVVGGGHSHVEVLRQFGADPMRGVAVTLVSTGRLTPYSGMLPGLVAGHYGFDECHIDLDPLARYARAAFHQGTAAGLDPGKKQIRLDSGETIGYDVLSLDIGSTPVTRGVPGAEGCAIPAKPVERLLEGWDAVRRAAAAGTVRDIVVAGGGAAGIELALAMRHRLAAELHFASVPRMRLVTDAQRLLETYPPVLGSLMLRLLERNEVQVSLDSRVLAVEPRQLRTARRDRIAFDALFWITGAQASAWPAESGLATDARGFVLVDDALRSVSHPEVFAAGDCASQRGRRTPKSGVYAVRQGRSSRATWAPRWRAARS